jgi:long-chain acyl-CoA synthetase
MAAALAGRPAGFQDLPRLAYTRMVIEESLRIYPPSWSFSRFVVADDEIGGHLIPAGSVVQISPYVTHRRPDLWESPERFDPGRFDPAHAADRPRFAYYPFGGGTRSCIARDLVMMEMPLVLTTVLAAYHLRAVPGHPVAPLAGITLRPRAGMPMTLTPPAAPERPAPPATIPGLLFPTAAAPGRDADLRERVRRLATALERSGIAPGERVAIFAENSSDWRVADLAALTAGAVTVPLLPDLPLDEAVRLLAESGAKLGFVGGSRRLADLLARRAELPGLLRWVFLGGTGKADGEAPRGDGVSSLEEFLASGAVAGTGKDLPALAELAGRRLPEEPATLVYTPGTAGAPRPVLLTHGNLAAAVQSLAEGLPVHAGEVAFSSLPLALVGERTLGYLCLLRGATVADAGSPATPESIAADLRQARPHVLSTTPATWKHFLNGVFADVQEGSPSRRRRFGWAVQVGRASLPQRLRGRRPPGLAGARLALADRLVFAGIRERLGGRLRLAVSGGTRLPHGWITLLWAMGIPVYEGYGLAETASAVTQNTPGAVRPGTAGPPLPGVEVRIAADGEILVRGDNVAPSAAGIHGAAGGSGWLATGDAGFFDDAGMLILLGRKEEIFVDADGTTVAPGPLAAILISSHFVAHALVAGEPGGHPFALLAPDFTMLEALCRKRGIPVGPVGGRAELVAEPRVREIYSREVDGFNQKLAPHDRIRAWELVADEWSIASGELTAAGTVRRPAVLAKYRATLDRLASQAK